LRELYFSYVLSQILYSERGNYERKKRKLQRVCCRLYPFILLDNKNEGPGNFSGGRSPQWVNHIYLCLYCIVYIFFPHFFYFIAPRSYFSSNIYRIQRVQLQLKDLDENTNIKIVI
jgi:hypothetical protein